MCSSGPPFPGMGTGIVQQMPQLQSPIPIQSPNNYGLGAFILWVKYYFIIQNFQL
jgi:hypothetical protein